MRAVTMLALATLFGGCTDGGSAAVTLPYTNDFTAPPLGKEWEAHGGIWQVTDGALLAQEARNAPLWLAAGLPPDVVVSLDAAGLEPDVDIKFEIFGDGEHHASGYIVILGGWRNSKSIIARLDEHGPERTEAQTAAMRQAVAADPERAARDHAALRDIVVRRDRLEANRVYHLRFTRAGHELRLEVDGAPFLSYFDPSPLAGEGHDRFAINNWMSPVRFDNLRIEAMGATAAH